jgi:Zn-dependent M28 family amino/carboxypeptidase
LNGPAVRAQTGPVKKVHPDLQTALDGLTGERILKHVTTLASDKFEGRAPGTRGEQLTVKYIEQEFKKAQLLPGNPNATFFHDVEMVGYRTTPRIEVTSGGVRWELRFIDDFVHDFPALRPEATANDVGVVFAGYGITAPQYGWDDYKGVDVRNKLVLVLSGEPALADRNDPSKPDASMFKGDIRTYYGTREYKFDLAARKGTAGIFIIYDPEKSETYSLFQTFAKMEGFALKPKGSFSSTLISGLMTRTAAQGLLAKGGLDLTKLEADSLKKEFRPVESSLKTTISVKSKLREVRSRNVVARLEGSDPALKNEYVIYSAHWDHLGRDTALKGDQIYNGAIDDAIGTAQLIEIANAFSRSKERPKRSIFFLATTAEEKGYLGARAFVQTPPIPLKDIVADINLDGGNAWGITSDITSASYGLTTIEQVLDDAAKLQGRTFVAEPFGDNGLFLRSDQIEFAKAGVPSVFPFSGWKYIFKPDDFGEKKWEAYATNDYHKVTDEVRPDWNLSGAAEDSKWLLIAGYLVANSKERPAWLPGAEFPISLP